MNIALLASKGGVGKSTLSILLFEALRQAGRSVAIRDWDIQGSSNKALKFILGDEPLAEDPEIVIYDTPPRLDHNATTDAILNADIVLVVTSPSPPDLWEAEGTIQFAQEKNPNTKVCLVFNKIRKGTLLGNLIEQATNSISAQKIKPTLSFRECYQHAMGRGWDALDRRAREEVLAIVVAVTTIRR